MKNLILTGIAVAVLSGCGGSGGDDSIDVPEKASIDNPEQVETLVESLQQEPFNVKDSVVFAGVSTLHGKTDKGLYTTTYISGGTVNNDFFLTTVITDDNSQLSVTNKWGMTDIDGYWSSDMIGTEDGSGNSHLLNPVPMLPIQCITESVKVDTTNIYGAPITGGYVSHLSEDGNTCTVINATTFLNQSNTYTTDETGFVFVRDQGVVNRTSAHVITATPITYQEMYAHFVWAATL